MLGRLYHAVYALPLSWTLLYLLLFCFVWRWVERFRRERLGRGEQRVFALVLGEILAVWLVLVLHNTVFSRTPGERRLTLQPFYQLRVVLAGGERELIRSAWMNALLFVPGGVLLAALLPERWRGRWRLGLSCLFLMAVSMGIEWTQYRFALGWAETDDVICNTAGALLGAAIQVWAVREKPGETA